MNDMKSHTSCLLNFTLWAITLVVDGLGQGQREEEKKAWACRKRGAVDVPPGNF